MRQAPAVFVLLFSVALSGQTPAPGAAASPSFVPQGPPQVDPPAQILASREIDLAKAEIERVSELVKAGTLPRTRLDEAMEKLADAQDETILSRSLYGELPVQNLSEQTADEMVAAAQRRVERQMKKVTDVQKLVADGVVAKSAVDPVQQELEMRRMNLNLAHSRSKLISELASISRYEHSMQALQGTTHMEPYTDFTTSSMVHYEGNGFLLANRDLNVLESSFEKRFGKTLPISASGQTATHDALGFDHRGRLDVAVNPNEPAGIWLRHYLEAKHIPYFAFLRAVPGKATGAHIHIGPGSGRLHYAD